MSPGHELLFSPTRREEAIRGCLPLLVLPKPTCILTAYSYGEAIQEREQNESGRRGVDVPTCDPSAGLQTPCLFRLPAA